jgi:hypothetical protein
MTISSCPLVFLSLRLSWEELSFALESFEDQSTNYLGVS